MEPKLYHNIGKLLIWSLFIIVVLCIVLVFSLVLSAVCS